MANQISSTSALDAAATAGAAGGDAAAFFPDPHSQPMLLIALVSPV